MLSDRDQIANLLERYCWTVDRGQWDAWLDCFTEDGVFDVRGGEQKGRETLRAFILKEVGEAFRYIRHMVHTPMIEVLDEHEARARCYFELRGTTSKGGDFEALGSYEDEIVKTAEGWKFRRRKARFDYFIPRGAELGQGGDAG